MQTVVYRATEKSPSHEQLDIIILLQVIDIFGGAPTYFQIAEFLERFAADERHPHVREVYAKLDEILSRALDEGYVLVTTTSAHTKPKYPSASILLLASKL